MATLRSFIQETITRTYLTYTFDCDTPHDMLVTLKQRVAPTDQARKIELINQYQKLKEAPHSQNLDTWFQQWEKTYKECKQLNLPDVEDDRPLYDFLSLFGFESIYTSIKYTSMRRTPMRHTPIRCTPVKCTPVRCTPMKRTP
jgi:hypothetical protein